MVSWFHLGKAWELDSGIASSFFTKSSRPRAIQEKYDTCRPAPKLSLLDAYRTDGQSSMRVNGIDIVLSRILCG